MRNDTKNYLTSKVLISYRELRQLETLLNDLIKSLEASTRNANFKPLESIGKYAREMPRFNVLTEYADYIKAAIRKVCTGEVPVHDALVKANEYLGLVQNVLALFNQEKIEELLTK